MSAQALLLAWIATCTVEGAVLVLLRRRFPTGIVPASLLINSATNPLANLSVHALGCQVVPVEVVVVVLEAGLFVGMLGCTKRIGLAASLAANLPTVLLSLCL